MTVKKIIVIRDNASVFLANYYWQLFIIDLDYKNSMMSNKRIKINVNN